MDLIDFLKKFQQKAGRLPTERELAAIRSRMEGGNTFLQAEKLPLNVLGQVNQNNPDTAVMNTQRMTHPNFYGTMLHELEHTDQMRRAPDSSRRTFDLQKGEIPKPDIPPTSDKQYPNTNELGRTSFQKEFKDVFTADNSFFNQLETFANIAEYESTLPIGVSLSDTPLGKKLKEMGMLEYVMANLGGRKFSESPEKSVSPKKENPKVNPKASYARQAIQYLGFKDPLEDTTKD